MHVLSPLLQIFSSELSHCLPQAPIFSTCALPFPTCYRVCPPGSRKWPFHLVLPTSPRPQPWVRGAVKVSITLGAQIFSKLAKWHTAADFPLNVPELSMLEAWHERTEMSWSLSWPSQQFKQNQDPWMWTCICVTSSGVPQGAGVLEGAGLKNPAGLEAPITHPRWPGKSADQDGGILCKSLH